MISSDNFFFEQPDGQEALFKRLDFEDRIRSELDDPEKTGGLPRDVYYTQAELDATGRFAGNLSLQSMTAIDRYNHFMGAKPVAQYVLRIFEGITAENFYDAE